MLLHYYAVLDAPTWCEQSAALLNWIIAVFALLGAFIQFLLDRYLFRRKAKSKPWLGELFGLFASRPPANPKPAPAKRAA